MTTGDEPAGTTTAPPAAAAPDEQVPPGTGLIYQALSVEIGIDEGQDPFDATLLLAGPDTAGREIAVWTRLTPTTINTIIEQLTQILNAQQQLLGVPATPDTNEDTDVDQDDEEQQEGRVKRFLDPMGIRHLKDRSPRITVILGAAIASLVLLAFVLQLVHG